ncbi:aromatic ring-hydroxylating dioxygenase subunit alpha [Streptomyces sp. NPDC002668]|uniref:aromatic ring-hydroxylating oxygenase subunit alpha n=1 Tax=Streptomyces sp. NPDC002668 TaxID=3154422 RepID=UPI003328F208
MTDTHVQVPTAPARMGTQALLGAIAAVARLPLARATALPPEAYWSPELYELEVERIFRREWMCVAREEQIPEAGDWLAVDLVGEALVITRDEQGRLNALSRVCRHRSMDLLNDAESRCGTTKRLMCPYHLWTYRLDGRLAGAPLMHEAEGFDKKDVSLPRFPIETWHGFVFVNLDPQAEPLAPRMGAVEAALAPLDLGTWRQAASLPWGQQPVNWKIAVENGSEAYHHMGTHRETLQPLWPTSTIVPDGAHEDDWFSYPMVISKEAAAGVGPDGQPIMPTLFPVPEGATRLQRSSSLVTGVFPMFFFSASPDMATWFDWRPTGPESHELDVHILVPPEAFELADFQDRVELLTGVLNAVQAEDAHANKGVMRGLRSAQATRGRLSHLERPLWQFHRYVADRLGLLESP